MISMKNYIVNYLVNYVSIKKNCTDSEKEIIKFGIGNLYLLLTKIIIMTIIAIILNIFTPYIIFVFFYSILRSVSFGFHAEKSWQCWVSSLIAFIGIPIIIKNLYISIYIKQIISIICILVIYMFSPADTKKRPIIDKYRRKFYKYVSTLISIFYSFGIIIIQNQIVTNSLLFSLILQSIIISPITYKIFGQTYNNYKSYRKEDVYVS